MSDKSEQILAVYLQEYEQLKSEQAQRIGFRDNMIYVTLGLFGAILSFALSKQTNYYAFLVIPWVCLIMGWTYLVNDEKISALGRYFRLTLAEKIKQEIGHEDLDAIFGWETAHRNDSKRKRRKIEQLIIDEITFVISGITALMSFWFLVSGIPVIIHILCGVELILLLVLGVEIIIYADLDVGR